MAKLFILYDARACGDGDTDEATIFVSCDSMKEAKGYKGDYGAMACFSYDIIPKEGERGELVNETWEWDYYPQGGRSNGMD